MATTYLHYKYENTIQVSKGSILVDEKCDNSMPFFSRQLKAHKVQTSGCENLQLR